MMLNLAQSVPRKYPSHRYTTTTSMNCWYKAAWGHAFIPTQPSESYSRNRDSFDQAVFLQPSIFQFWWAYFCYQLTGVAPSVVFCCSSPSASRFDVLCIQRCSSADLGWNERLFDLLVPFYQHEQFGHFSLTSAIKAFLLREQPLTGCFSFLPHSR